MGLALAALPARRGRRVAAGFQLVWANLAVGFLGDEDSPANLMFLAMLAVALAGSLVARLRARALARTMASTAAAQVVVGGFGYFAGFASPGGDGIYEIVMGTTLFAGLWLTAAWSFHKAARDRECRHRMA